ncbi:uncharacterized protein AMSG_02191 [Thecamonas trahens ATCC 50062]|uniref:Uncharacterized protein n=1 Tax=Thecamonas trahens ATCC 50062 TaxID=461836 RepID=A0A0L0DVS3_THETB|nr:hypothetical protein AMSG_02191 [Thecamonas trahens ATCC 50062]KNC56176.1 hypothetical protein AMSG_02191 [Thecamonas trahens ATCC 50062]|eukprot:XP_013761212.1 hypothetical protein AMSG_02191 [Thecamonas trahens ATCC 50062]
MVFLDALAAKASPEPMSVYGALRILSLILAHVPQQLLAKRADDSLKLIGAMMAMPAVAKDVAFLRAGITCLAAILESVPRSAYRAPNSVASSALDGLISLVLHEKPKVRKQAAEGVRLVLGIAKNSRVSEKTAKFARKAVASFALATFAASDESGIDKGAAAKIVSQQLHALGFLRTVIHAIEGKSLFKVLSALFSRLAGAAKARSAGSSAVYSAAQLAHLRLHLVRLLVGLTSHIDAFGAAFADTPEQLESFVDSLTSIIPPQGSATASALAMDVGASAKAASSIASTTGIDVEVEIAYVKVMRNALFVLGLVNTAAAGDRVPAFVSRCIDLLSHDSRQLAQAALNGLRRVLASVVELGHLGSGSLQAVIAAVAAGLSFKHKNVWGAVLAAASALFIPLTLDRSEAPGADEHNTAVRAAFEAGISSGILARLSDIAASPDFKDTRALYHCVGEALRAFGPGPVCAVVPMALVPPEDTAANPAPANDWMLLVMKKYVVRAKLQYFMQYIEPAANAILARSLSALNDDDMPVLAKNLSMRALLLWDLFPAFCRSPVDVPKVWDRLAALMGRTLESEPELRTTVCAGLRRLISHALAVHDGSAAAARPSPPPTAGPYAAALVTADTLLTPAGRVASLEASLTLEQADAILSLLVDAAPEFIDLLVKLFLDADPSAREYLGSTLKAYAHIARGPKLDKLFRKLAKALLKSSTDDSIPLADKLAQQHNLTALAVVLVGGLSDDSLELLYKVIEPQLTHTDTTLQKTSYRVLSAMITASPSFLETNLARILATLRSGTEASLSAARSLRLSCVAALVRALPPAALSHVVSPDDSTLLVELIVATRESGKAAAAMDLMKAIATQVATGDADYDMPTLAALVLIGVTNPDSELVAGSLGIYTYIMVRFGDHLPEAFVIKTFPTVIQLLKSDVTAVVRAALHHLERAIKIVPPPVLGTRAGDIAEATLDYAGHRKGSFRKIIRSIWEKLVVLLGGFDELKALVPKNHNKYFANLRHELKVRARNKSADRNAKHAAKGGDDDINDVYLGVDSDDDDDATDSAHVPASDADAGFAVREVDDEFMDFLDPSAATHLVKRDAAGNVTGAHSSRNGKAKAGLPLASDGRIVVAENDDDADDEHAAKPSRKRRSRHGSDDDDNDNGGGVAAMAVEGSGPRKLYKPNKRAKRNDGAVVQSGAKYRAKKAGGDVKLKGEADPYAYIKLNRKDLNKRHRRQASGKYEKIVSAAQEAGKRAQRVAKKKHAQRKRR